MLAPMPAGLVLSTLLALALSPPDDAIVIVSDPAPATPPAPAVVIVEPAPAPAPAPAPGTAVITTTSATVITVAPLTTPPPTPMLVPRRPSAGAGLFFGGMLMFSLGVGMQVQQFGMATDVCSDWLTRGFDSAGACFYRVDHPGQYVSSGIAFGSGLVMTSIGGAALGQREAWETHYGDGRVRNRTARRIAGAVLLGMGLAAFAADGALIYMDWKDPCVSFECHANRRGLWIGVGDVGVAATTTAFGLLSWSSQYGHRMNKYQRMRLAFAPSVSRAGIGAQVGMRF